MRPANPLDLLCCPSCRGELTLPAAMTLHCPACGDDYPILDGIPVLFPGGRAPEEAQRYWDSPDKAALYNQKVEGEGDPFGVYNHQAEIYGLTLFFDFPNLDAILDAGCGNGRFLPSFPPDAFKVGIDASFNLLRLARERGGWDLLVCCELEHLPFKDDRFGTVLSCRVLQHIHDQAGAVAELGRVTRVRGNLILEVYNTWNLKTLYKNIRMSPWQRYWNAPFRWVFRSMSPFAPWGLDYDRYTSYPELAAWMRRAGLDDLLCQGVGFGYHKYFFQPFYLDAWLNRHAPRLLTRYYQACFELEKRLGPRAPFRYLMEKLVVAGVKTPDQGAPGVLDKVRRTARQLWEESPPRAAWRETRRERRGQAGEDVTHLRETLAWVTRAQDAVPGGVSRGYAMGWRPSRPRGWQPAYPETTGYLIPTLLACARGLQDDGLRQRALALADWEVTVRMKSGAVPGGTVDQHPPTPAVFNTGQVILGWLAAWRESRNPDYLAAARRAGEFLLRMQDADGAWRRGNSRYADAASHTYNVRVAWALVLLGQALGEEVFIQAGLRNVAFALTQQLANGWFRDNCLSDPGHPLLHTICYTLEGLLGVAMARDDGALLARVRLAVDHLVPLITPEGRIPGRLDSFWQGSVAWDCLTGNAQLAQILLTLAHLTGHDPYRESAARLLHFLKTTQNLTAHDPGLRGGVKGSHPFGGDYGRHELLNWPAKFFLDALLVRLGWVENGLVDQH